MYLYLYLYLDSVYLYLYLPSKNHLYLYLYLYLPMEKLLYLYLYLQSFFCICPNPAYRYKIYNNLHGHSYKSISQYAQAYQFVSRIIIGYVILHPLRNIAHNHNFLINQGEPNQKSRLLT